jgi:hypothetical protein
LVVWRISTTASSAKIGLSQILPPILFEAVEIESDHPVVGDAVLVEKRPLRKFSS